MNTDFLESYELYHHGIQGQKWGERRYQYQDGSLTPEGKRRYGIGDRIRNAIANNKKRASERKQIMKDFERQYYKEMQKSRTNDSFEASVRASSKMADKYGSEKFSKAYKNQQAINTDKFMIGATLAAVGMAAIETAYLRSK